MTQSNSAQAIASRPAEPRGQADNVIQLPTRHPNEAERLRQAAFHRDECGDCIGMGFAGLLAFAAWLFAAALLRHAGIQGATGVYLRDCLGFLTTATGIATLLAFCMALVHFIQLRQL